MPNNVIQKVYNGGNEYLVGGGSEGQEVVYLTQAEYDALPASKLTDGKIYKIKTSGVAPTPISINDSIMFYDGAFIGGLSSTNPNYIIPDKHIREIGTFRDVYSVTIGVGSIVGDYLYTLKTHSANVTTIIKVDLSDLSEEEITISGLNPGSGTVDRILGEGNYLYIIGVTGGNEVVRRYNLSDGTIEIISNSLQLNNLVFVRDGVIYNQETNELVGYDTTDNFNIVNRIPFYNGSAVYSGNSIYSAVSDGITVLQKVYTFNS